MTSRDGRDGADLGGFARSATLNISGSQAVNYVYVSVPHKRHVRMRITESWSGTGIKPGTRQYDVCKRCYIKMPPKRPRWKTVADFTDMPGGGVDIDELLEAL